MLIQLGIVSMGVLDTVDMLAEIAVFMLADMIGWLLVVCLFVWVLGCVGIGILSLVNGPFMLVLTPGSNDIHPDQMTIIRVK
jgi:hypothetical protein